ncbi:MAG: tetratricopeptide repeat protein [Planctomycetota bacterium]
MVDLRGRLGECGWRDPDLLLRAASLSAELGNREEAVSMLQRALVVSPGHAYARAKLAELADPAELESMGVPEDAVPLSKQPLEPFIYPLRGMGPFMIAAGGIFFGLLFLFLGICASVVVVLPVALAVSLVFIGYLIDFFRKVTMSTASGGREAPDWPDFDVGMMFLPLKAGFVYFVGMLPAAILAVLVSMGTVALGETARKVITLVLVESAGLVLPMMALIFFMRRSALEAVNPVKIFRSIAACGKEYWIAVFICLLIAPVREGVMALLGAVPFVGILLSTAAMIYFVMVTCRALGLVYRSRQHKLSW